MCRRMCVSKDRVINICYTINMQVVVGNDENQDSALKRFRREVMSTGLVQEVRVWFCCGGSIALAIGQIRQCLN